MMFVRLACFLRRQHNYKLRGSDGRVYLECRHCGFRSPGWEMGPKARPVPRQVPSLRLWLDEASSSQVLQDSSHRLQPRTPRPQLARGEFRLQLD